MVPVEKSIGTKYGEPGLDTQMKLLFLPGAAICTKLLSTGTPVPRVPITLIGAGLQVVGWQMALIAEFEGRDAVTPPVALTAIRPGLVDTLLSATPLMLLPFVSVTVAVSARGVFNV